ncbi:BCCT family transporter [Rhodothalassium salexigens]|uniref:BCCT family transporter n=1 Tax=Rhodothalassium salexigens TaxID=1086 RepID=UPI001913870A|nr:choline BCCT transporter BetT [Rhodothalassium salexigens]
MKLYSQLKDHISVPVFFGSAIAIFAVVIVGVADPTMVGNSAEHVRAWISNTFGWFYILLVAIMLGLVVILALGPVGRVRLGPDTAEPDFSYVSWIAMLFSAGMGIGLMFFGVYEPITHFANPPTAEPQSVAAAREAMEIAIFHWGVHAWGIYILVGLALAYFGYRRGLPLTIRSALYPIIGDRIYGPIGHAVDIFAVIGTMFGVATSLGLGVQQVNAGFNYLFGLPQTTGVQIGLIAIITGFATLSVVAGLYGGIRRISEANLVAALALLLFALFAGPTVFLMTASVENLGQYMSTLVSRTFELFAFDDKPWLDDWTLFYWAWWIAWSPFVGMFIARISRGRTIREFVLGGLAWPLGFTVMWMTVFGSGAIQMQMTGVVDLAAAAAADSAKPLFIYLEHLPFTFVSALLATVLSITFFVTSSDSGSLVIDIITAGGDDDPPKAQRIFWAVTEGVVAAVLLLAGGLGALQAASIAGALPFSFVLLAVMFGLLRSLQGEYARYMSHRTTSAAVPGAPQSWRRRLHALLHTPDLSDAERFLTETVRPALEAVEAEVAKYGYEAQVIGEAIGEGRLALEVGSGDHAFHYEVQIRPYRVPSFAMAELAPRHRPAAEHYRADVHLTESGAPYDILGMSREEVIADVLVNYEKHTNYVHLHLGEGASLSSDAEVGADDAEAQKDQDAIDAEATNPAKA